ncbi:MAG TPA: hypothetical protein VFP49_06330, partial [Nitrososphaeraceae archaeon]|nr:hypothetical protein [Nitrososphaeraceae archaeon]
MDLKEFNSALPKPWLNIKANSVETKTLDADVINAGSMVIDNLEAKVLVLVNQGSVPNPAVGRMALFTDSVDEVLTSTNPLGVTVKYLQNPSSADEDMNGNDLLNVHAITTSDTNVRVGNSVSATSTDSVVVGVNASANGLQS